MLSTILKHLIYEQAIDVAFSSFQNNFNSYTNDIKLRDTLTWIEIRFARYPNISSMAGSNTYTLKHVIVLFMDSKSITICRPKEEIPAGTSYMEHILLKNIVGYEIK